MIKIKLLSQSKITLLQKCKIDSVVGVAIDQPIKEEFSDVWAARPWVRIRRPRGKKVDKNKD